MKTTPTKDQAPDQKPSDPAADTRKVEETRGTVRNPEGVLGYIEDGKFIPIGDKQ